MSIMAHLADALDCQDDDHNDYKEAEDLHQEIFLIGEKVPEKKHPNALDSMAYLADLQAVETSMRRLRT